MTEYWLQKKTLGGWSVVTWYDNESQARDNYNKCLKNDGYSWRLVKVETLEEARLKEEVEIAAPEIEEKPDRFVKGGWGNPVIPGAVMQAGEAEWNAHQEVNGGLNPVSLGDKEHGMVGKVWLIHHGLRVRARVDANDVDKFIKEQGYEKAGPKTQFKE